MVNSLAGLVTESDVTGNVQWQLLRIITDSPSRLKIFSLDVKEESIARPRWWPDTRTELPTDRRSITFSVTSLLVPEDRD
jgi:hypothetical protein